MKTLALLFALFTSVNAFAQNTGAAAPIRLIVPFTPGTGIDLVARQLAPRLSESMSRPVVVENRVGASGNIGTEAVVRTPADGNTLLVSVSTLVMNRALYPKLSFDALKDLEPVAQTSWGQLLLVASTQSGIQSAQDLLNKARSAPGKLNYASPGNGTPHHLAMELLKQEAKVFITHIPYRGTGPAVTDVLGGQVEAMFMPINVALPHVRAGKLKALAISSDAASPLLPGVPPLKEVSPGKLVVDMWYGVFAPKGLPAALSEKLNRDIKAILASPEIKTAFETQGMSPAYAASDAFRQLIAQDAQRWEKVIRARNIQPD
jgi:tripartite-type tricarboxylate transporter receptor subunit TctC